jgi:predicted kinase
MRREKVPASRYRDHVPRLIHLNGPPAVGKSTLARRWADEHPGTLNCDIDRLRPMIGGWESSDQAPWLIRTAALAMITAYLRTGHDVVLPQAVGRHDQLDRFRTAAAEADAAFVCVLLTVDREEGVRRFHDRDRGAPIDDAWARHLRGVFGQDEDDTELRQTADALDRLAAEDHTILRVPSTDPDTTYDALLVALQADR